MRTFHRNDTHSVLIFFLVKQLKIGVVLPAYGGKLDVGHAGMWLQFGYALADNRERFDLVLFSHIDANPVADARNLAIEEGLNVGADWVMMIDSDTYYRGENDDPINDSAGADILRMISEADKLGPDVAMVGAPVRARRWENNDRTVWKLDDKPQLLETKPGFRDLKTMSKAPESYYLGKLVEVPRIGGAFIAVNLDWIRRECPDPPWSQHEPIAFGPREQRLRAYGEDVGMCDLFRTRNGRILCDGRILPLHMMCGGPK